MKTEEKKFNVDTKCWEVHFVRLISHILGRWCSNRQGCHQSRCVFINFIVEIIDSHQ